MEGQDRSAQGKDGTRIFWRASGEGAPPIVLCDGIGCAGYIWGRLAPDLARRYRTIHWNYRGHGRSDVPRDLARLTLQDCVDDLLAVMDDAGERRVVLAGHSMGVQVVLEAHRRAPERVLALVLVCGSPGRPLDTFHDSKLMALAFPTLKALVLEFPEVARLAFRTVLPTRFALEVGRWLEVNRQLMPVEDLRRYLEDLAHVDPAIFVRMLESAAASDLGDHLPAVDVPTLVVAGEKDTFTPMWLSERMHAAIPGAELLVLPAGTHTGPLEHPELVSLRLEKFLAQRVVPLAGARAAAPVPFRVV
jgi:pimeloyl-ACP methyl ester carboxylesterase